MRITHYFTISFILCLLGGQSLWAQTPNQNAQGAKAGQGDYTCYKFDEKKRTPFASGKPWGVSFTTSGKDGDGNQIISQLVLNRAGVIEEIFVPDLPNHPAYFTYNSIRAMYMDGKLFYYTWVSGAPKEIKFVLVPNNGNLSGKHDEWLPKIQAHQNQILADQKNARANLADEKAAQEAAEKLANSLKGKSVKSIAVKWVENPTSLGHFSKIKYGIEAQLSDGKTLKTSNLGGKMPWDDFSIEVSGAEFGEEVLTVWGDCSKIPNDQVVVKVKDKHGLNLSTSISLDLTYNESIQLDYSGARGGVVNIYSYAGARGGNALNLIIKSVGAKTSAGKSIHKVEVVDASTGEVLNMLKLGPGQNLSVLANGGNGSYGRDNTNGGNGGDGGNVTYLQDSSSGLVVTVNNKGGSGGKHDTLMSKNGATGKDGRYDVKKQAVSLGW